MKNHSISQKSGVQDPLSESAEPSKNMATYSGVASGFMAIDHVTQGWQPSDLIVIAARPSMGKTAFALSMAYNMAVMDKHEIAFFSLEMSTARLMTRLMTAETSLSETYLKSRHLLPEQCNHFRSTASLILNAPLFIDDTPDLSVLDFRSKAHQLKSNYDIKIIIIDDLQLMNGNSDLRGNREEEVAFILRTLKATAKELNVPIIIFTQMYRSAETTKRPQLSDLRESLDAIEQSADIVAFIHRPEYYGIAEDEHGMPTEGVAEFIIAKHRNGAECNVKLRFLKECGLFIDADIPAV